MINKAIITTEHAPAAIGTYSQAVKVGNTVYLSGQIPIDPESMAIVAGGFRVQAEQVIKNLSAVCKAANGDLAGLVKINVYLTDLNNFADFNEIMAKQFQSPYPARATLQVSALPKGALIEIDGVLVV